MIGEMVNRSLKSLGIEAGRVSPRERAMLAGLAAAGAVVAAVYAFDWSERMRDDAARAHAERESFDRAAASQTTELTEQVLRKQLDKARRMAFSAATIPIARAAAQAQLERMANQALVTNVRVTPDGDPAGDGTVKTQVFSLQGQFDWPSFMALVGAISEAPQSIGMLGVSVDAGTIPTFVLTLRAPLVTDGAS